MGGKELKKKVAMVILNSEPVLKKEFSFNERF
jgi:hypothetical protein